MVVAKLRSCSCRRISARLLKMASALRYTDSCLHGKDTSHFQHAHKSLLTHTSLSTRTQVTFNTTQVTFNMHASHFQHAHKSLSTRTQVTFNMHTSHFQHARKSLSTRRATGRGNWMEHLYPSQPSWHHPEIILQHLHFYLTEKEGHV